MSLKKDKKHPLLQLSILRVFELLGKLIDKIQYILIPYFSYKSIDSLAGKNTDANIFVKVITSIFEDDSSTILVILTAASLLYALSERAFRKKKTEYLVKQIHELELKIDPKRTGSGLLPSGDTHPKDK